MKAISVYPSTINIRGREFPDIRLYADSAIGRDVMPLFVPDIDVRWLSRVCLAARIVRLGKNIAEKFALRYVDAISLVNVLYPDGTDHTSALLMDSGAVAILDGAVTTGQWIETDIQGLDSVAADICGQGLDFTSQVRDIPKAVSLVSRLATLKTGDIIILESTAVKVPLAPNTLITASLMDHRCLRVKVK